MKTIIIGNSGSGKTWLARHLTAGTQTPIIHLDDLFGQPGGFDQKRDPEEVARLIDQSKLTPWWIVEGVFGELAERYFAEARLLIWLDIEWQICKIRLLTRGSESKHHLRREQSEKGSKRLVDWASHYYDRSDLRSFVGHQCLTQKFPGKSLRLTSEEDVNRFASNDLSEP